MPDLKQALRDFVATSNSGKYADEATLLSKFPELKGYDVQALRDFVATSNSGKYATEDEVFSKFPEFAISAEPELKKKVQVPLALPSEDTFLASQSQLPKFETTPLMGITKETLPKYTKPERVIDENAEQDYYTGAFGTVLRGVDMFSPIGVGDFIDDISRSVASGYRSAKGAEEADKLLLQGTKPTLEQVDKFIQATRTSQELKPSAEYQDYQKTYEEEGKSFWGVVKGLAKNPSVLPEVLTSSLVQLATNKDALIAGASAIGTGAAIGGGIGATAGGVGALPGAVAGATKAVPYAFGLASSILETGNTFGELLTEELKGKEMTKENVKAILEDPEKYKNIRNRAVARGVIIGAADALTGKIASSVGAKVLTKSAAKSATGAATRGAVTRATATGAGIEALGGSAGEAAARGAIGQEMDISEIALEGLAELPGGIRSTLQARLEQPSYKINGAKVTAEEVDDIIDTMNPVDLAKTKIEIKNDYAGRQFKIQDKIVTHSIKEQVRQGNPELNEPSLNAITELEKELKKLEGNTTQTGKDKAAAIRGQIKNIQENQLQEEAVTETIKAEQDAIQEQATDESVLRTEQPEVGLQQVVEGDQGPQVVTTGTQEIAPEGGTQEVELIIDDEKPYKFKQIKAPIKGDSITIDGNVVGGIEYSPGLDGDAEINFIEINPEYKNKGYANTVINNIIEGSENKKLKGIATKESAPFWKKIGAEFIGEVDEDGNIDFVLTKENFNKSQEVSLRIQPTEEVQVKINELEKEKVSLTSKALKQMPNSPIQLETRARIDEINSELKALKSQPEVSSNTQAPKFVRDITTLITPATVRGFSPLTKRIKKLSLSYDKFVKQYAKNKDPKVLAKIKEAENQILNDAKQEIIDAVAQVDGVSVKFSDTKRGLWNKFFEPSFNMILSISPQANTKKVSDLLFDFAEKYSQDAFILETDSEYEQDVFNGNREIPLTEFDENNLMHYPQIIYTFDEPITDEQVADLSVALENEGVDAFNINNNEIKVSVIKFFEDTDQQNLTEDEQYEERTRDLDSKSIAAEKATADVLGPNVKVKPTVRIKKSSYQGATNEGTDEPTRQYDRSDVLKSFKESTTKVETLAVELSALRQKEIDLQKEGKKLSPEDQARFNELNKKVQPAVQRTFETNKKLYEDAKTEVEGIAQDAIAEVDASISPFPIKRPERASVKAIRWYNAFTEKLGDGARVNIVVDTDANADKIFEIIDKKYPGDKEVRRITETTDLGYPKRLIEIRTSNGTIAEIQVITNEAYLAKDGIKGFTGDEKQKATAKQKLDAVRARLGWNIPDGLGHYFYEIQRDTNVDDNLRDEAARLSDLYYDAFTNPKSQLAESFMRDVEAFKKNVDAANKSEWDVGNTGKAPQSLIDYKPVQAEATLVIEEEGEFIPLKVSDVKNARFNKNDALDYIEDEKETESGRIVPYISSITVQASNIDGDSLGEITKVTDEDNIFYFTATDVDGNELGGFDGFETLGEAKQAIADSYNKIQKKEFDKVAKKKAKEKAKAEAKKAKAKAKAEPTVEEQVTGALDDLLALDPNDKTTLEKISNGLDKVIKDINKFEKENLGVNIALPVMKTILKAIKALVDAGVALQDAIKRVAKDNNVNSRDVIDGINAISQIAPIQVQYDALMTKADELIARQKARGIADAKIVSNLDTFIRNSDVYKEGNDAQKKIMEREARTKMGVGPKRAVSIGRVLGALKDITNISREEKMLVIKQIRDLSRDAAKELAKDIREMASKGKITSIQAANIVSRFGKVNMLNEISVSNFVDYMAKVFANAEYADKIDVAKSKLKMAKKNIVTKIGIADGLVGDLNALFSMNPTLIPNEYLGRYLELVDMFGARQAVLTLDEKSLVSKDVKAILNEIDNEQSKADELADRFNASENKVYKDDELDYAASVKKMLDEKEIDEKEAETMRKYKEDIAPQVEETELTEEELAAERKELTDAVRKSTIDGSGLSTKYERDTVKELSRVVRTDAVDSLTNTELKNLLKVIDNINNNYLPHYGEIMLEKLNGLNSDKGLAKAVEQGKMYKFSELYSKVKAAVAMQGRTGVSEMIRRNPLFYIDQLFGNFKTKEIFNSLFNEPAKAVAAFKTQLNRVQNILEKAEEKVAKSLGLEPNAVTMSKFKMMTYMIQLEYESNKGNKEVNPASDYLKATIKHIDAGKSRFGERDANMLQQILKDYSDTDGNIDNEMLYNSFNQAEKDAINDIRGINESLREQAEFTAAIIRGDRIDPLNNYVHLNVLHEFQPSDLTSGSAFVTEYNNAMRPSTKAKSLIARTGKVSPLNFDIFASAQRGAKFVLMDFNLTKPIRTSRKTINGAIANLQENADKKARNEAKKKGVKDVSQITGRIPKEQREIINAINDAFEETVSNLLTNAFTQDSTLDIALDYISKQGYRTVLAGTGRFISELSSNIGFALISDPKAVITAAENVGFIMSTDAPLVMENVNSKQSNRIFPTDTLSGRLIDTSILGQASGIRGAVSKNPVKNKIQQIWNRSGKKYVNAVELQADALISTPDKAIMRIWFGSFANQFQNITGEKVDFKKIAANDEKYMDQYKDAIDKATELADERSVMVGATDNPFMGILKGTVKPDQKLALKAFNNMNNFMTKFLIFEYVTARTAIMAAIGNGSLTKQQGGAILGAVATRMVVYGLLLQMMGTGLMGLIYDDDEPETEKSFMQKLGQAFASAFSSLLIGRDFGNAVKNVLNYGIEEANEKYLDFLREGDYDPYKDGIAYTLIPRDDSKQTDLGKLLMNMGGAYTPALNTAAFIVKKVTEKPKVKEDAIARREKELKIRIPLEVLGNAGLIPLYKDIRKAVMKDLYKDLEKAEKTKGDKKKAEEEKLQGFKNQEDMKRYDYELWYRTFGPDAPDFDEKQAERLLKREKDSVERAMKDEMYDYTPKPKKSKGGLQKLY